MASSNLLDTKTVNLLDLLGNGRTYRVPPYQRDYSWQIEHWEDLWNDIRDMLDAPEERHYMGALVVEGKSDREFQIIDGQQRVATLSVLALAVIARLKKLASEGLEPEQNQERADQLRQLFIGRKDPASLVESSRLTLNHTDNPFYQDYLIQLRPPLNQRGLVNSNRLLWNCFQYYSTKLESTGEISRSGEKLARLLSEAVGRQLLFIQITVSDDISAYTVFETLNARGLELSTTDLLKNFLFSRVPVDSDREALHRRWQALLATVQQQKFPDFLRYHLLCTQPEVRNQRLFKIVRSLVKDAPDVFHLLEALEQRAEIFAALSDPNHGYWIERPECKPIIRELLLFRVRQMTPLLFAAWEALPQDFASILRQVSVLSFRYLVVSGLNPNALESAYQKAARALLGGTASSPRQVFSYLVDVYVDDSRFETDFANLSMKTAGVSKKLVRYILARLESDVAEKHCDPDTDPFSIEHVLPENPTEDWSALIARQRWDLDIYRLGNLTLLDPSANRQVGNAYYPEKVRAYEESRYLLTRRIAQEAPENWTTEHIVQRQQHLARRAVHLWRLDYGQ